MACIDTNVKFNVLFGTSDNSGKNDYSEGAELIGVYRNIKHVKHNVGLHY